MGLQIGLRYDGTPRGCAHGTCVYGHMSTCVYGYICVFKYEVYMYMRYMGIWMYGSPGKLCCCAISTTSQALLLQHPQERQPQRIQVQVLGIILAWIPPYPPYYHPLVICMVNRASIHCTPCNTHQKYHNAALQFQPQLVQPFV